MAIRSAIAEHNHGNACGHFGSSCARQLICFSVCSCNWFPLGSACIVIKYQVIVQVSTVLVYCIFHTLIMFPHSVVESNVRVSRARVSSRSPPPGQRTQVGGIDETLIWRESEGQCWTQDEWRRWEDNRRERENRREPSPLTRRRSPRRDSERRRPHSPSPASRCTRARYYPQTDLAPRCGERRSHREEDGEIRRELARQDYPRRRSRDDRSPTRSIPRRTRRQRTASEEERAEEGERRAEKKLRGFSDDFQDDPDMPQLVDDRGRGIPKAPARQSGQVVQKDDQELGL